jgi:hypothetical protein
MAKNPFRKYGQAWSKFKYTSYFFGVGITEMSKIFAAHPNKSLALGIM